MYSTSVVCSTSHRGLRLFGASSLLLCPAPHRLRCAPAPPHGAALAGRRIRGCIHRMLCSLWRGYLLVCQGAPPPPLRSGTSPRRCACGEAHSGLCLPLLACPAPLRLRCAAAPPHGAALAGRTICLDVPIESGVAWRMRGYAADDPPREARAGRWARADLPEGQASGRRGGLAGLLASTYRPNHKSAPRNRPRRRCLRPRPRSPRRCGGRRRRGRRWQ